MGIDGTCSEKQASRPPSHHWTNENSPVRKAKSGRACEAAKRAPFPRIRVQGGILEAGTSTSGWSAGRRLTRRV